MYGARGLDPAVAAQVAEQLMTYDALGAHARDELAISTTLSTRPVQAALASAGSFAAGAVLPMLVAVLAPEASLIWFVCALARFLGVPWCNRGPRRRCEANCRRAEGDVLGRAGHGGNGRGRNLVRRRRLIPSKEKARAEAARHRAGWNAEAALHESI
jgi:hypothetical protein